ncbi:nitroreductase [Sulfurivirga sp.]|uniref:nitroreductase family protein n=1 Tax=Sulfurivirga sp. TaxID=2614236 RepID=UPI0025CF5D1A|nr:nitroreductase [Sulfurivirga sp.]
MTGEAFIRLIRERRTVYDFKPDPVPRPVLEQALEAAVWAPNHGLSEPWRFHVPGMKTRAVLAQIYARLRADKRCEPDTDAWRQTYEKALQRFLAVPGMVLVGQQLAEDPLQREEDAAAVACAIQNFQLAMWAQEVGVQWSTGPVIRAVETYELLGIEPKKEKLVALLYYGYPACVGRSRRSDWREKTRWLD